MKKINLILLLIVVLLLSGCDQIVEDVIDGVVDGIVDDITGSITDIINGKKTNVKIADVIADQPKSKVTLTGTISAVNETGFIFTDGTSSIYVSYANADTSYTKGATVKVEGSYRNNSGHELYNTTVTATSLNKELSVPTNLVSPNDTNFLNSYAGAATHVRFEGVVNEEDGNTYLHVGDKNFKLDSAATKENNSLKAHVGKKVLVSGWAYKKDASSNVVLMLDNIDHAYDANTVGNAPVVSTDTNYYAYSTKNNVKDLTTYFSISDDKDGNIAVKSSMITANLTDGQNIVTLKVTDSDSNVAITDIIIAINAYHGYETNESITVIDEYCLPTTGDVKVLVIPVKLSNRKPATEEMRTNIQKAFFGTEADTGWESLNSYYHESSYGKLNITGDVTPWFTPEYNADYYANYYDEDDYLNGSTLIMNEALEYFRKSYDYSKYDSDKDGFIDSVYLIYNYDIGGDGSAEHEDFYWAYAYWDLYADYRNYAKTKGYSYIFMSYDFFVEDLRYSSKQLTLNCETLIHETGHLMNLDDYYDYDDSDMYNNDGGYCGSDMMDYNFGDHGPYSKIILDWVNPVMIEHDGIYELPSFTTSGTTFLISANNRVASVFDEYYLIDFYAFNGLNGLQGKDFFQTSQNYAGVRVSHINSVLQQESGSYPTTLYNNTDTKHKLIRMLEADYDGVFDLNLSDNEGATISDFYQKGQTFGTGYYKNYKSSKNNEIPFTMTVLDINDTYATVKITFK